MPDYTVTKVQMEPSDEGGRHEHIEGVCTSTDIRYTRQQVVESLDAGKDWQTLADGNYASIRKLTYCKHPACLATPYITTEADDSATNNLDNLPRC